MSFSPHSGIFAAVERQCAGRNPAPELMIRHVAEGEDVPISLEQARSILYDRCADPLVCSGLWRQIAERSRFDAEESEWPLAVVWLGLPGLRRTAFRLTCQFRAERADVEAELITGYLEALAEIEADTPEPGSRILRSACSRAWSAWRRNLTEIAVEGVGGTDGVPVGIGANGFWEVEYDPFPHAFDLSAGLRISVPAHRVEGVRIGALAQEWGLAGAAACDRISRRGRQVGAISLRRSSRDR
ncbi:hypothetical protein ACIRBY_05930 [Streptomyces sp. NPDC096136]|uniref:hypothetical protein n=1 Tax=Streptomyces sp. NPDC096136 TaxID=3366076 RepID=UPI003814E510